MAKIKFFPEKCGAKAKNGDCALVLGGYDTDQPWSSLNAGCRVNLGQECVLIGLKHRWPSRWKVVARGYVERCSKNAKRFPILNRLKNRK